MKIITKIEITTKIEAKESKDKVALEHSNNQNLTIILFSYLIYL